MRLAWAHRCRESRLSERIRLLDAAQTQGEREQEEQSQNAVGEGKKWRNKKADEDKID